MNSLEFLEWSEAAWAEEGDAWESPGSRVRRVEGGGAGRTTALNLDDSSSRKINDIIT